MITSMAPLGDSTTSGTSQTDAPGAWTLRVRPRQWQTDAMEAWARNLRGVVAVVTGGGKTVLAEMAMLAFRQIHRDGRVLIVVPTLALLDQWYVSLQEDLGVDEADIATFSSESKPRQPRRVNLIVLDTARRLSERISGGQVSMLIVDECHRAGSPENHRALRGDHVATLGLSATPERQYDEGFEAYVVPALGDVIFRYDYEDARRDGVISPFELIHVQTHLTPDEQVAYDRLTRRLASEIRKVEKGAPSDTLKRIAMQRSAVSIAATLRVPVALRILEETKGSRAIVFHERVDAANQLLHLMEQRHLSATIYHTGIGADLRRSNLRLFRHGLFDVLICVRALDEGLNVPEASVAVVVSSSASTRQRIQRLGRVLRPAPGKTLARVYTVYATKAEEDRLRHESEQLADAASTTWLDAKVDEPVA